MQESETMAKVREASKPLVGAVVEGGKVVGEKLHQSAEAAKPGLEAVGRYVHFLSIVVSCRTLKIDSNLTLSSFLFARYPSLPASIPSRRVSGAVESLAEKTKPALEKAGDAIKTTTKHVVDEGKPIVKKVSLERAREGGQGRAIWVVANNTPPFIHVQVGTFINHNMGGKSEGGGRGDPPTTV